MNEQVTNYITQAPDEQKLIMHEIRQLIHQCIPKVEEHYKWSRPIFSTKKDIAYLKTAKAYVTLGFFNFDKLQDDGKLLEGTGKDMRHIKIKRSADINKELLTRWFKVLAAN